MLIISLNDLYKRMGISASSSIPKDMVSVAYDNCPGITTNNSVNLNDVRYRPDLNPTCQASTPMINQKAGVDHLCLVSSLQDNLAQALSTMDAQTQNKYGLNASTNIGNLKIQLHQQAQTACVAQNVTFAASVGDTTITSCDWHFVQNATARSACEINYLQRLANSMARK